MTGRAGHGPRRAEGPGSPLGLSLGDVLLGLMEVPGDPVREREDPGAPEGSEPATLGRDAPAADHRLRAPAAARNRAAILGALRGVLPPAGLVQEVASGSGEHVAPLARHFPRLAFQPSDVDPEALRSAAAAWCGSSRLGPPPAAADR
jgi:hypothetical protein